MFKSLKPPPFFTNRKRDRGPPPDKELDGKMSGSRQEESTSPRDTLTWLFNAAIGRKQKGQEEKEEAARVKAAGEAALRRAATLEESSASSFREASELAHNAQLLIASSVSTRGTHPGSQQDSTGVDVAPNGTVPLEPPGSDPLSSSNTGATSVPPLSSPLDTGAPTAIPRDSDAGSTVSRTLQLPNYFTKKTTRAGQLHGELWLSDPFYFGLVIRGPRDNTGIGSQSLTSAGYNERIPPTVWEDAKKIARNSCAPGLPSGLSVPEP